MAEENENTEAAQPEENAPADRAPEAKKESSPGGLPIVWLSVTFAVVALAGGGGFVLSKLLDTGPDQAQADEQAVVDDATDEQSRRDGDGNGRTYIQLKSITVTLDGPTMARYLQAEVTLAIGDDAKAADNLIQEKMPEIRNWLNLYLASQTLDSVRGDKNLNRMLREIQEALNERLWPDGKPMIKQVLFEGINVQ